MPLPKPRAGESNNQFISRCMIDDTMLPEYPNRNQRYAICNNLATSKGLLLKQAKKRIASNFHKQIRLAEKKNYPIAYNYYIKEYEKATEMFINDPTP